MGNKKGVFLIVEWVIVALLIILSAGGFIYINNKTEEVSGMVDFQNAKLVLYEGPKSLKDATEEDLQSANEKSRNFALLHCVDTKVKVDGYDCYVYDTNVNHTRSWVSNFMPPQSRTPITYFDFEGVAKVEVTVADKDLQEVKISPEKYHITPNIDKESHKITFTITEPDTYTLTFNNSPDRALHIFANPLEKDAPKNGDANVVYIGPGEWNIDSILLEDNQTLYISGGAVIHGIVNANYAKNVTVKGRGIIDGSGFEGWAGKTAYVPLKFDKCDGVTLENIILLNPNAWVCSANGSKNGNINGLKIISSRPNGDGITLQSCENFQVQNCFVRSWDDSLVVKNYGENSKDITFSNMQLWTDLAQSMEIGYETNKGRKANSSITNITFKDITVLNNFHKPVISIHNADDALVKDITFKDIVVENAQMGSGDASESPYLIDMAILNNSNWSTTKDRGQIQDITIENVKVLSGKFCPSRIIGFDETHKVDNVTIKGLEILGEKITSFEQGKFNIDKDTTSNLSME
jgi:hypothetical protein